jgi:serine O-acetyltransferase
MAENITEIYGNSNYPAIEAGDAIKKVVARSFPPEVKGNPIKRIPRPPVAEDDVIINAGTTIRWRVTRGNGSIIGGNTLITADIPAGNRVTRQ